jgi:hypothetical protein
VASEAAITANNMLMSFKVKFGVIWGLIFVMAVSLVKFGLITIGAGHDTV